MEPIPKKRGRPPGKKKVEQPAPTLHLDPAVDRLFTIHAKKLKLSKRKYANAAITYFVERGLNPAAEQPQGLADIGKRVAQEARSIRVQNVDIGNRLISLLRNWEKSLYGFLQQQQDGTLDYLEQIEKNVLQYQVAIESARLLPMIEMMTKTGVEAYIGRVIGERTNLHVAGKKETEWPAVNKHNSDYRDKRILVELREYIKNKSASAPRLAPKPQVLATPPKAPAAPVVVLPGAGADSK